jgi:exosortase
LVLFFGGTRFTRAIAFPLGFLFFITPFPDAVTNAMEIGSQKASAEVYAWMISMTGTPVLRDGQTFTLPGLTLVIAQECSGIRSSFVLFLTGLLAGHMFLRKAWKKSLLAFFVIPLGIVRNGFRVLVLSLLTIHWDPDIINSALHHRGGPIFFALSLIPFFLFLFWLRKTEGAPAAPSKK